MRALAAMAVVLYHFWPGRVPGGFVGVDVFFVISGFLITSHLLREAESTGRIELPRFWARRARRLLPASYLVIVVSLVGVFLLLPRSLWGQNLRELIAASVYVENWQLAHDAVDYLASANSPSIVQHYWTLGVEEQFYLVWPLLIAGAFLLPRRSYRRGPGPVIALVTVSSFALSVWLTAVNPSWSYFVTPGRVWEFGVGALLAVVMRRPTRHRAAGNGRADWIAACASWLGLLTLVGVALGYSEATPFPGAAALPPTLATALVIAAGMPPGRFSPAALMRLRPIQWIGEVSYSLYLWHWPLLILAPAALGHGLDLFPRLVLLASTLLLAWVTTRYVEDPIRRHHRVIRASPRHTLLAAAAGAVVLVVPAAGGIHVLNADAARADQAAEALVASNPRCFGAASMDTERPCHNAELDDQLVPMPENVRKNLIDYPGCFAEYADTELLDCSFGERSPSTPDVLLIGDSHAQMFLPTLVNLAKEGRMTVSAQLKAACPWAAPPNDRPAPVYPHECASWRDGLGTWLGQHAREFDLVIATGRMDNLPGTPSQQSADLANAWRVVTRQGVPVVAIRDNPMWRKDPNECLAEISPEDINPRSCGVKRSQMNRFKDPQPAAVAAVDGAHLLDLQDLYCHLRWCPAVAGGVNIYRDYSHLSVPYAATLGPYVYRRIVDRGLLPAPR